jgi:hypothetical protein
MANVLKAIMKPAKVAFPTAPKVIETPLSSLLKGKCALGPFLKCFGD